MLGRANVRSRVALRGTLEPRLHGRSTVLGKGGVIFLGGVTRDVWERKWGDAIASDSGACDHVSPGARG
jgi:hypothetical protein